MLKLDSTFLTITAAGLVAITVGYGVTGYTPDAISSVAHAQGAAPAAQWAASATGRVEPKSGEIRLSSQTAGRVVEVAAENNDFVRANDLLVRLDDEDIYVKIIAARAEVSVREREREEETATGLGLDRRKAEDALAAAERELFTAREAFDAAARTTPSSTDPTVDPIATYRTRMTDAKKAVEDARQALRDVNAKPNMPTSQRLEASLAAARAELSTYEIALERTRIRAPVDGSVLNMIARVSETAVPSPDSALVIVGDLSGLRLRAEVEERDAAKVHVGQGVVVKSDAFPDQTFTGTVTSISQSLGAPRIASRGPRRPNDVEVIEVMVALDGKPPLFTGMRVDTFFKNEKSDDTAAKAAATTN